MAFLEPRSLITIGEMGPSVGLSLAGLIVTVVSAELDLFAASDTLTLNVEVPNTSKLVGVNKNSTLSEPTNGR